MRYLFLSLLLSSVTFAGGFVARQGVNCRGVSSGLVYQANGDNTCSFNSVSGTGDVVGQAASVDSEVALFSGTTGKALKRLTGTGLVKATSGVASVATLVNADVNAAAAIARSKLASGSANRLVVNDGSGVQTDATAITASKGLCSDANGIPVACTSGPSATEMTYLAGVTSAIQTQLGTKAPAASPTFTGTVTAAAANFSGSVGLNGGVTGLVQELTGFLEAGSDKTYVLDQKAAYAYTINTLDIATASGTTTAAVKINGTNVTGISAVSVSSTPATGTASAANSVTAGDKVTLVLSSSSSPVDLAFTLKVTR